MTSQEQGQTGEKELHLRETTLSSDGETRRVKPPPKSGSDRIPIPFSYMSSNDGTDENLLILFHGLGDSHVPFTKLGKQLKLPQTAVLVLRAPEQVPFLYEEAYQWYPSFDELGELVRDPNPKSTLELLMKVITYLVRVCRWREDRIHLFGFAQGGSVAAEFGLYWWREKLLLASTPPSKSFGSIISIGGPMLSFPSALSSLCPTPLLVVSRSTPSELTFTQGQVSGFKKGYRDVREEKYKNSNGGMPIGKEEWEPIMKFLSERLERRVAGRELYEVL